MTDTLILGGGLAGSMAALELAAAGRPATLLERSTAAHHKVCGEFLSTEAIHYLERHDVNLPALGAVPITHVRLALHNSLVEAPLPFPAYSLTRRTLDEELLRRAESAGTDVRRGCIVTKLTRETESWNVASRDEQTFRATNVFLATGKHDLRGWPRPAGTHRGLIAFKMYFKLTPQQHAALGSAVELILFRGGYAGLQPVEDGAANLCLLITAKQFQQAGSSWPNLLGHMLHESRHLEERLGNAEPRLQTPLAASRIPYGHMQHAAQSGLWHVGDQAAVIPSFCGDGMSIALHSATLAAQCLLRGQTSAHYTRQFNTQLAGRLALATRLSQALVAIPSMAQLARVAPGLLPRIASMTRIPASALI